MRNQKGLPTQTKTILLSKGMRDDVDQFLLEPPHTRMLQNGVFRKEGVISKRQGLEVGPVFDPIPSGEPTGLLQVGGKVAATGSDTLYKNTGTAWESVASIDALSALPLASVENSGNAYYSIAKELSDRVVLAWQEESTIGEDPVVRFQMFNTDGTPSTTIETITTTSVAVGIDMDVYESEDECYLFVHLDNGDLEIFKTSTTTFASYGTITPSGVINASYNRHIADWSDATFDQTPYTPNIYKSSRTHRFKIVIDNAVLHILYGTITGSTLEQWNLSTLVKTIEVVHVDKDPYDITVHDNSAVVFLRDRATEHDWLYKYGYSLLVFEDSIDMGGTTGNFSCGTVAYDGTKYLTIATVYEGDTAPTLPSTTYEYAEPSTDYIRFGERFRCYSYINTVDAAMTTTTLLQFRLNCRPCSNIIIRDSKAYVAMTEVVIAPRSFFAESDLYLNEWKYTTICRIEDRLIPVLPLSPNVSYDINHLETRYQDFNYRWDSDLILNREIVFPYTTGPDTVRLKDEDGPHTILDNNVTLRSSLSTGALPKTKLRVQRLSNQDMLPAEFRGSVLMIAGGAFSYDGYDVTEASPFGVPKISHISAEGQLGQSTQTDAGPSYTILDRAISGYSYDIPGSSTPNPVTTQDSAAAGLAYDLYALKVVMSFEDAQGVVHRSAPSPTVYCTPTFNRYFGANNALFCYAEMLSVEVETPISLNPERYTLELYGAIVETEDASVDAILSLLGTTPVSAIGLTTVKAILDDIDLTSLDVDTNLEDETHLRGSTPISQPLYTESGELPPGVLGGLAALQKAGDRVYGVPSSERNVLIYSKRLSGDALEFPVEFRVEFPEEGDITGITSMDDKLIVFFPRKIYVVFGGGPDNLGNGPNFSIQPLPGTIGCSQAASIVGIPTGVLFRGQEGFYLLDRGLTMNPKRGVSSVTKGTTVTASAVKEESSYVVFSLEATGTTIDVEGNNYTTTAGRPPVPAYGNGFRGDYAVVYNYRDDSWSVFTNYDFTQLLAIDDKLVGMRSDWTYLEEYDGFEDGSLSSGATQNLLYIQSPWIKARSLQDQAGCTNVTTLGRYYSEFFDDGSGKKDAGDVKISFRYDYERDPNETKTQTTLFIAPDKLVPEAADDGTHPPQRLQLGVRPGRRKCQAIEVTITEQETASAGGQDYRIGRGFEISGLDLEIQLKRGSRSNPDARKK